MAYMTYRTPAWSRMNEIHARTAQRPISARLKQETAKAFLIETGLRTAWVPKRLVKHDEQKNTFTMPHWLAQQKLLD